MTNDPEPCQLQVTGPAEPQLAQLTEGTAAAIVEFLLGALRENPHRVGVPLRRELAGLHAGRRGTYRITYQIIDDQHLVVVHRIDHRASVYRPR